ncbi:hypothetical protein SELMODRAFT_408652 [Selaginella moellendorffii]|uniref:Uncharacterized protein n=1 Tax=Selaginella moellendorffii TaxID=88036 RepID=D8R9I1_SELML|nr:hypothetical protein SELMODRAFT_408652 [Selaginella moellendorffii]
MRMLLGVCGCSDQVDELSGTRSPIQSRRKIHHTHPQIVQKLEDLSHHQRCESKATNTAATNGSSLHTKYDEISASLAKCKDELRELQQKSLSVTPSHLRQKYVTMGDGLKRIKEELLALENETKSLDPESQKAKYEALHIQLAKSRKEIEDELQKCWTQLKLHHLESQFASATYGKGSLM